jgi:hypothetical protein
LFVVAAVLCFGLSVIACVFVAIRRKDLGLTVLQTILVTVVSLVCLPCSANFARAVSKHRVWILAASDLPLLGFDVPQAKMVWLDLRDALANAQRFLPEDSQEYRVVSEQLRILESRPHEQA